MSKVKRNKSAKSRGFKSSINELNISNKHKKALNDIEAGDYMGIMMLQMEAQLEAELEMIAEGRFNWN